jgi:hypothetical protein
MARTIAEIQNEILIEKEKQASLNGLTNSSKTSIWNLWMNIVATAIWVHEKIVEKNALISRPHTLNWYREQALNFQYSRILNTVMPLTWKDGSYQYDNTDLTETQIEEYKIIKHCAVSEIDLETVLKPSGKIDEILSDYFHNKVGVVFIKVATVKDEKISRIDVPNELFAFKEYIARIKDAGNQVYITSDQGDILKLNLTVYFDPLSIYINPKDIEYYKTRIEAAKTATKNVSTSELTISKPVLNADDYLEVSGTAQKEKDVTITFPDKSKKTVTADTTGNYGPVLSDAKSLTGLITAESNGIITTYYLVDPSNGSLISDGITKPVEEAINDHLKNIEFNGAFVKTFLTDAIQKAQGVKIPVLTKIETSVAKIEPEAPLVNDVTMIEYFIPRAGYFDMDTLEVEINYIPYTFYREKQ